MLEVPLPSAPRAVDASIAMRQVVMESAIGIEMVARARRVGDDFGIDVQGFGKVGADACARQAAWYAPRYSAHHSARNAAAHSCAEATAVADHCRHRHRSSGACDQAP